MLDEVGTQMKKISICIPCYNEEENVKIIYNEVKKELEKLPYNYEIIFADNASTDKTQENLKQIAAKDTCVKVIINMQNYGLMHSQKNCIYHANGDAVIGIVCDLQEPPSMIPSFIREWEKGFYVVWGQKTQSEENRIIYKLRTVYYNLIDIFSNKNQLKQVTGFGLLDKQVVEMLKRYDDYDVSSRYIIPELGYEVKLLPYKQARRSNGNSSFNFFKYLEFAINSFVYSSNYPIRILLLIGILMFSFSLVIFVCFLIINQFRISVGSLLGFLTIICISFLQISIGIVGEYVNAILKKVTKKPLVIEKELINFDD